MNVSCSRLTTFSLNFIIKNNAVMFDITLRISQYRYILPKTSHLGLETDHNMILLGVDLSSVDR